MNAAPGALEKLSEMRELLSWMGRPPRSPRQTHGLNESDCEVLDLGGGTYLATTIDTIAEEMSAGLLTDPFTMGWVTAMASLSDLAAVGANPLGMLLGAEWGKLEREARAKVGEGFQAALSACGTYWLGGDSGTGTGPSLTGVALGLCQGRPLTRLGLRPGDALCVTGRSGDGPALGMRVVYGLAPEEFPESAYRPRARVEAGLALAPLARVAMDASDGLLSTLDTLAILNGSALELEWNPELLSEPAVAFCRAHDLPLWTLWAAELGDYELVFAFPPENLEKAKNFAGELHVIGRVGEGPGSSLSVGGGPPQALDLSCARKLLNPEDSRTPWRQRFERLLTHIREARLP